MKDKTIKEWTQELAAKDGKYGGAVRPVLLEHMRPVWLSLFSTPTRKRKIC